MKEYGLLQESCLEMRTWFNLNLGFLCKHMPRRVLEFYCGIGISSIPSDSTHSSISLGGLHCAFARTGLHGSIIQAFDWDRTACQVYAANHSPDIVTKVSSKLHLYISSSIIF